ncbi:MAG TPA: YdcF family protein [Thermoanaerobaculia bacterium]|nr:YdcF family protein [Thermoanaerobaculia bacterium]
MSSFLRGVAAFLAVFTMAGAILSARGGMNPNLWWLDVRAVPEGARGWIFALIAIAFLMVAVGRRRVALPALWLAAVAALVNATVFYKLVATGAITSHAPVPMSLLMGITLIAIAVAPMSVANARLMLLGFVTSLVAFPLLQVVLFGSTDYRRPADVIVVFGARAYADGSASSALSDRVRTACELYRAGLAPTLLFSGGPGDGAIDEPHAMTRLAQSLGVPASAILLDPHGVNTDATVQNTMHLLHNRPAHILAVSHFYHLPRIKLAYQRAGVDVYTVPSRTTKPSQLAYNVPRECVAFWAYYLRAF